MGVRKETRQSVVAAADLTSGTVLLREMLTVKRPGTGILAADLERVVGRTLVKDVAANSLVQWSDVGGEAGE